MMMEKLNVAIQAGKENKATAKSDVLIDAQQSLGKMTYDLNTAMAEVGGLHSAKHHLPVSEWTSPDNTPKRTDKISFICMIQR